MPTLGKPLSPYSAVPKQAGYLPMLALYYNKENKQTSKGGNRPEHHSLVSADKIEKRVPRQACLLPIRLYERL